MIKAINWKVRIGNKTFWLTIVPALALLVQVVAAVFGITIDLTDTVAKLVDVINAVFASEVIVSACSIFLFIHNIPCGRKQVK